MARATSPASRRPSAAGYSIAQHRIEMMPTRPAFLAQRERLLEGLLRAGLPER